MGLRICNNTKSLKNDSDAQKASDVIDQHDTLTKGIMVKYIDVDSMTDNRYIP